MRANLARMDFDSLRSSFEAVPAWSWALQAVGLATAYVGAELNARQRIEGFHVWLASNVALAALHAASHLWLLLVLDLLFLRVNVLGIRRWRRDASLASASSPPTELAART
jgi:nicotinamide riboside transporter PnuC